MSHSVDGRCSGATDGTEVVRERENRPAVRDSPEVGVGGVGEGSVVDKLSTDDSVFARLPSCSLRLRYANDDKQLIETINSEEPNYARSVWRGMLNPLGIGARHQRKCLGRPVPHQDSRWM